MSTNSRSARGGPVRIWREVVDKRTGEVREEAAAEPSELELLMNAIYRRPLPRGWAARELAHHAAAR